MPDVPEIGPETLLEITHDVSGNLRQIQKMETLGTLVGGIAHDFNNILAILQGHLTILQEEGDDPAIRCESLHQAQKALRRATGVVRQLLAFARKAESNFVPLDIDGLVEELLQMVREAFPKTVDISFSSDGMNHWVAGDPNQLDQVLLNLCINARDAMPAGGWIALSARSVCREVADAFPEAPDQEYVCLGITDTGTGMSEATQNRIFEPYFTTKDRQASSGLGLAMVYGIVKFHNGFIKVESELGKGTTFLLYFPRLKEKTAAAAETATIDENRTLSGSESVLFAEDEALLLRVIKRALEKRGYHVLEASDGLQAVETYREHKDEIAVVVLDMGLPKLDGWEVFQRLRAINPALKAIVTSGYVDPELKDKMLQQGMMDVISKPFPPVEIVRMIRRVIDSPRI
jgi:nitrogen-specific signal transduction histidine kinase/ActR/RegA family two-component response regulator